MLLIQESIYDTLSLTSNYSFASIANDMYLLVETLNEYNKWGIDDLSYNLYRKEIRRIKPLDYEKEQELIARIQNGDKDAEEQLMLANLGLVIHIAKKYQNRGLLLNDLISEGYFGLMKAVQTVEDRGFRFQSYACHHIRSHIVQAIEKYGNAIYYPYNIQTGFNKINKFISRFQLEYGYPPSNEEIAENIKLPADKIEDILSIMQSGISIDSVFEYFDDFDLSDAFINSSIEDLPEDFYLYSYLHPVDDELYNESLEVDIGYMLNQLSQQERNIIMMSFGIKCKEKDLNEIALNMELTRERVRQIKENAIRKLRQNSLSFLLKKYLG